MADCKLICSSHIPHKEFIDGLFKVDFPIAGGDGTSIEDAIIIVNTPERKVAFRDVEFSFFRFDTIVIGCSWTIEKESFFQKKDRLYHKVEVTYEAQAKGEEGMAQEDTRRQVYFDITSCVEQLVFFK